MGVRGGGTTGEESVTKLLPRSAICPSLFHGQWEQLNVRKSTGGRERSHRPLVGGRGWEKTAVTFDPARSQKETALKASTAASDPAAQTEILKSKTGRVNASAPEGCFSSSGSRKSGTFCYHLWIKPGFLLQS